MAAQVRVSDPGQAGNSLNYGNTTRKIDVHPNGTIYVCYHGSNGVRVARSLDNGATFGASVQVTATDYESEIAVSSTGIVYVAYVVGGNAYLTRSLDQGLTFQTPVSVGTSTQGAGANNTVHIATDAQYVYMVDPQGGNFYVSSDNGQTFSHVILGNGEAFSDVHVDPLNHNVVVVLENGDDGVDYLVSTDNGATFPVNSPIQSALIYYSVGALSSGINGRYLLVTGLSGSASVNLGTQVSTTPTTWPGTSGTRQSNSIAADIYGNVVVGYTTGTSVDFNVSNNIGATFGSATTVATVATTGIGSAAINTTNGDTMFAYETGGVVYLKVYQNLLIDYDLAVSTSNLTFANQTNTTSSSPKIVTVTNQSSSSVTINSIAATGDFSQTNNAPTTLAPGASFTTNVIFTPTVAGPRAGQVAITYNTSLQRVISLSGTGTTTPGVGSPSTQTTGLAATGVAPTQMTATWTRGSGSACAVFMAQASSGQASPADFQGYAASTTFGGGATAGTGWYCVYNGTGTSVAVTGLTSGTAYRLCVCEYSGAAGAQTYNTSFSTANLLSQSTLGVGYTLTFSTDGTAGATLTGATTQAVGSGGSATAVTAHAPAGYAFVNWTGTHGFVASAANPLTVANVTAAYAITANFAPGLVTIPTPPPAAITVGGGGSTTVSFTVDKLGTVNAPVILTASGLPNGLTCSFSESSVDLSGGPATITMTISANPGLLIIGQKKDINPLRGFGAGAGALLACGVLASGRRRKRMGIFLSALLLVLVGGLTACSSHSAGSGATTGSTVTVPAGTYPITIKAVAQGAVQATTTFNLTLN